jgi:hypothetical protein
LTLARARKITGLDIETIEADGYFFVEAAKDGVPVALSQGKILKDALKSLVEAVYKLHSAEARERDDHRCSRCGRITGLEQHHPTHRSMGRRDDTMTESLCHSCHQREHGGH